jgi:Domain of unknown function (DUF929)
VLIAVGAVLAVVAVVIGIIAARTQTSRPAAAPRASALTTAQLARQLTTIPASVLNAVGAGHGFSPLTPLHGKPLTLAGKPEVIYVGAEYCPFCAAERWALTVALSRFGTFSGLHFIRSSGEDLYSGTATLSFYKSTYASRYLVFSPAEIETVTGAALQTPTPAEQTALDTYDVPPYVSQGGSIPFVDFANQFMLSGAQYAPSVLGSTMNPDPGHLGLSWSQIVAYLHRPSSPVAQSVLAAANDITAAVCKLTGGQPGSVCQSRAVTAITAS